MFFNAARATTCNVSGSVVINNLAAEDSFTIGTAPGIFTSTITCVGPGGSASDTKLIDAFVDDLSTAGSPSSAATSNVRALSSDFSDNRDLDGDGKLERIDFSAQRHTLSIAFIGEDGGIEMTKVFDNVKDLRSIAVQVQRTLEGHREIGLRSVR